ncbi:hypothetical protein NKG94_26855 [Micromonospora sp. M12]
MPSGTRRGVHGLGAQRGIRRHRQRGTGQRTTRQEVPSADHVSPVPPGGGRRLRPPTTGDVMPRAQRS